MTALGQKSPIIYRHLFHSISTITVKAIRVKAKVRTFKTKKTRSKEPLPALLEKSRKLIW